MNRTIPDDGRVRTVAEGKNRLKALRFAKTIEGKRKAAEDASSKPKIILEKLRQITYGVGFNWEERFRNAPRYTDVTEQEGGLALSPVAATGATTDQAFVEILHECNALCVQQLPNAAELERHALMRCSVCHPAQLPRLEKIALVQQASHVLKITELTHCLIH